MIKDIYALNISPGEIELSGVKIERMDHNFSSEVTNAFTMTSRALSEDEDQDNVRRLAQSYLISKIGE